MKRNYTKKIEQFDRYISRRIQPIKAEKEAYYLSKKCAVSIEDVQNFLYARECYYTRPCSDSEFLMCDELELIADYLDYYPQFTMKILSSLLYHSNLFRANRRNERQRYQEIFPSVSSFMQANMQKGDE